MKLEIRFIDGETVVWDMQEGEGEMVLAAFEDYLSDRGPKGCACRRVVSSSGNASKVTLAFAAVASMSDSAAAPVATDVRLLRRLGQEKRTRSRAGTQV